MPFDHRDAPKEAKRSTEAPKTPKGPADGWKVQLKKSLAGAPHDAQEAALKPPSEPGLKVADIPSEGARRYAKVVDRDRDGVLSQQELDAAAARPDPMATRLLEKAFGGAFDAASLKTGADLRVLLLKPGEASGEQDLAGPSPDYGALFQGPESEWVVAFGGDTHHASSEKAPPDVSQYRGFKAFLERLGFRCETRQQGVDSTGFAIFAKSIKGPPDGHDHKLTVKVFNTSQYEGAADEYQKVDAKRRGYFSLSHAGEGLGLGIGGQYIRPENVLESPAPGMVMGAVACKSYDHYAEKIAKYMDQKKIPKDKLTYLGCTQEVEMTQPDGAFGVLKQAFAGVLGGKNVPTICRNAQQAYNPIMASYDPESYAASRDRMVMDKEIQATPVLKGMVAGKAVELPSKRLEMLK